MGVSIPTKDIWREEGKLHGICDGGTTDRIWDSVMEVASWSEIETGLELGLRVAGEVMFSIGWYRCGLGTGVGWVWVGS